MSKKIDLTGRKFGNLLVLAEAGRSRTGKVLWLCLCKCGQIVRLFGCALKSGNTISCGCENRRKTSERFKNNLHGKRFGRWLVIGEGDLNKHGCYFWHCRCDCGVERDVVSHSLLSGTSLSCGCLQRESTTEENHWNWKGGITPINIALRSCAEYNQWRTSIFERDNYTCQKCGCQKGGQLCAHHIKSFSLLLVENNITSIKNSSCSNLWELENGITLCCDCHHIGVQSYHVIYGKIAIPSDFEQWMGV